MATVTVPAYDPGPLLPASPYTWQVVAGDGCARTAGPVWSFTTRWPRARYLPLMCKPNCPMP